MGITDEREQRGPPTCSDSRYSTTAGRPTRLAHPAFYAWLHTTTASTATRLSAGCTPGRDSSLRWTGDPRERLQYTTQTGRSLRLCLSTEPRAAPTSGCQVSWLVLTLDTLPVLYVVAFVYLLIVGLILINEL